MITNGFKNLMKQVLSSGGTAQGLLPIKDVSGTTRYLAAYTAYPYSVNTTFSSTAADAGISVGSGNSASTENTYQLESTITSGLSGSVSVDKTVDVNSNSTITLTVTLSNTSGSDITIKEIGYKQEISAADSQGGTTTANRVFLVDRTVMTPLTIAAGGTAVISYSLTTKYGTYGVTDVEVDGVSVVNQSGVAEIDLTGKQDTLIPGTNISIAADGKTISASGGTTVVANPTGTSVGDLESIQIGSDIYDIPSGGGGTTVVANPVGTPTDDLNTIQIGNDIFNIAGSGGSGSGGQYTCDLLFVNDPLPTPASGTTNVEKTYTLSHSIDAYDAVYVMGYMYYYSSQKNQLCSQTIFKKDYYEHGYDNNTFLLNGSYSGGNRRFWFEFTDDTHIFTRANRPSNEEPILYKVYGIKYNTSIFSPEIYSEEEREVGVWIDGKPLYQKTILIDGLTSGTQVTYAHGIENIDAAIWHEGGLYLDSGTEQANRVEGNVTCILFNFNRTNLVWNIGSTWGTGGYSPAKFRATLWYTKTTDTPGSAHWLPGGVMAVNYSTTEQIIGMYYNGKTLYEKSWRITSPSGSSTENIIEITDMDLDEAPYLTGVIIAENNQTYPQANAFRLFLRTDYPSGSGKSYIACQVDNSTYRSQDMLVTMRYTKTTDTPGSASPTILATQAELEAVTDKIAPDYSTIEHKIGRKWIDGSDIYECTWDFGEDIIISNSSWTSTTIPKSNISMIIKSDGMAENGTTKALMATVALSSYVDLQSCRNGNDAIRYLTLQYTKTS